jgi:hypothetical protein
MKITENNNELIWTDEPVALKVFGLVFAASGLLFPAIAVAQFLKSGELNLKTFGILCMMGITFVLLGLLVNYAFKSTEVTVNKLLSRIIYKHGKVIREFSLNEIVGIEQVAELDDEGDVNYRPKLRTRTGEMLPVYRGYVQSAEMDSAIAKFNSFLNKS